MSKSWENVYVFISSTFNDMHAERDYLVKRVFPQLQDWCEKRKLRLVDIDLRWGVTELDATNARVAGICLERVDACRPFFVCFLGQRYGWVPENSATKTEVEPGTLSDFPRLGQLLHARTSLTEMEIRHAAFEPLRDTDRDGKPLLPVAHAFFYLRDGSYLAALRQHSPLVEPVYTDAYADKLRELTDLIRARPGVGVREYATQWRHEEPFRTPELSVPLRCPASLEANRRLWREQWKRVAGIVVEGEEITNPSDMRKADEHNAELTRGRLTGFACAAHGEREQALCDVMLADLQVAIGKQFPDREGIVEDELQRELDQHELFLFANTQGFIERPGIFAELDAYVRDATDTRLFVLMAEAGMGKSAHLGAWVRRLREGQVALPPGAVVCLRFMGTSDRSDSIDGVLRFVLRELASRGRLSGDLPVDPGELRNRWSDLLAEAGRGGPVVLVLDALNQLPSGLRDLYWLPREMPVGVKVVVSCKRDMAGAHAEQMRESWLRSGALLHDLPGLDSAEERRAVVREFLHLHLKDLDEGILEQLIGAPGASNPLYLRVVLAELRLFGSFPNLGEYLTQTFGTTPVEAFAGVLKRLESDPAYTELQPYLVVPLLFGMLAHARRGLSTQELAELLDRYYPWAEGAAVGLRLEQGRDAMHHYLRQARLYLARREGRLDFFYEAFKIAVEKRYAGMGVVQGDEPHVAMQSAEAWHGMLAGYFHEQDWWRESLEAQRRRAGTAPPTPRPANVRKVEELGWQRLRANQWSEVEELFTDALFLEAKTEAGMVSELANEFGEAVERMPSDRSKRRMLGLVKQAIGRDLPFIARHPTTLFQCLWNSSWWYDCPEAAEHYEPPEGGWDAAGRPWLHPGEKLHAWMEEWRRGKERACGFVWARSLRPTSVPLGGALRAICTGHDDDVTAVAFSPDGRVLASGSDDKTVRLWERASGRLIACLTGHEGRVTALCWTSDGRVLASGSDDDTVRLWERDSGRLIACLSAHEREVTALCWTGDGRVLASGSADDTVRLWQPDSGRPIGCLTGHEGAVTALCWTGDGRVLASGSADDNTVRLWQPDSARPIACLTGHEGGVTALCWTGDGRVLASGSWDKTVRLWERDSGRAIACLTGHEGRVTALCWTGDGRALASGSADDNTVRLWQPNSARAIACLTGHEGGVTALCWTGDGRVLASGSWDKTVRLWERDSGRAIACLTGHEERVTALCWTGDGRVLASGSDDKTVRLWERESVRPIACLTGHEGAVTVLCWMGDGRVLASGSDDNTIRLWERNSGLRIACLTGHKGAVTALCWTGDGRVLASGSADKTVRFWERDSGRLIACLTGHEHAVIALCWTGDGRVLASGSDDNTVRLWQRDSGRLLACLTGHAEEVTALCWTGDGQVLASGSYDNTVRLWQCKSGRLLACLTGHERYVTALCWTGDGRFLRSQDYYGKVIDWEAATGRRLTEEESARLTAAFAFPSGNVHHIIPRVGEGETAFLPTGAETPLARVSLSMDWQSADGLNWAGSSGSMVYLLRLEGVAEEPGSSPPPA